MLKSFFEIGCDRRLFDGLKIARKKELCEKYMGQYPVISLTFKGVSGSDFGQARAMMSLLVRREARRFQFLMDSESLTELDKHEFYRIVTMDDICWSL